MAGVELIIGMALGYMAFTDNGHVIGNKMAEIALNQAKKAVQNLSKTKKDEIKTDEKERDGDK